MPTYEQPAGPVIRDCPQGTLARDLVILAETGADIPEIFIMQYDLHILPFHVSLGGVSMNDGAFPTEDVFTCFDKTGQLPTTACISPVEYREAFRGLHKMYPGKVVLHLCYSACTTSTWKSAVLGSEGLTGVVHFDTRQVSGGECAVVIAIAQFLEQHPTATLAEVLAYAQGVIVRSRFVFVPSTLDYLRAGGRVSRAAHFGGSLLGIKPPIETRDGYLINEKKYRGSMESVCPRVLEDFLKANPVDKATLFLEYSPGLPEAIRKAVEQSLKKLGYTCNYWVKAGATISCHSGPGAFGLGGLLPA